MPTPETKTPTQVRPGQVWASNGPKDKGRTIRVFAVRIRRGPWGEKQPIALCTVVTDRATAKISSVGRTVTALIGDFHVDGKPRRSGYSLVEEASDA